MKYRSICTVFNQNDGAVISEMVINELGTSSLLLGYRQITEILAVRYGISVSKEDVRKTFKNMGPDGVTIRRNKLIRRKIYHTVGPGYIYLIHGNAKLKRWGFPIHGCIDGFSRKVMWLVVSTTDNDPLPVGNLYLNWIKQ